jgi:hypothetical protein
MAKRLLGYDRFALPIEFVVTVRARPAAPHRLPESRRHTESGEIRIATGTHLDPRIATPEKEKYQRGHTAANATNDGRHVQKVCHQNVLVQKRVSRCQIASPAIGLLIS